MATVQDILAAKGNTVHTIATGTSVMDATCRMNEHQIGALVVLEADDQTRLAGMFTERDVLRRVVAARQAPEQTKVEDVMTREVVTCSLNTPLDELGCLMKERRVRHLPVLGTRGELLGIISIGDLNAYHVRDQEVTIHTLEQYICGRV